MIKHIDTVHKTELDQRVERLVLKPASEVPMVTIKAEIKSEVITDKPETVVTVARKKRKFSLTEDLFNPDVKKKSKPILAMVAKAVKDESFDLEPEVNAKDSNIPVNIDVDVPEYIPSSVSPKGNNDQPLPQQTEPSWKCQRCPYIYEGDDELRSHLLEVHHEEFQCLAPRECGVKSLECEAEHCQYKTKSSKDMDLHLLRLDKQLS